MKSCSGGHLTSDIGNRKWWAFHCFDVLRRAKELGPFDGLGKDILLRRSALAERQVPVKMGARDDLHAAILAVNVVNRQPYGHGLGG